MKFYVGSTEKQVGRLHMWETACQLNLGRPVALKYAKWTENGPALSYLYLICSQSIFTSYLVTGILNFHPHLLPRTPRAALSSVPPCPIFKVCFFLLAHSGEGIPASVRANGVKKVITKTKANEVASSQIWECEGRGSI